MKRAVLLVIAILIATAAHGQVADSTSINGRGIALSLSGKGMMLTGVVTGAVGGGLLLLAVSPLLNPKVPEGEFSENMLPAVVYIVGISCLYTGAAYILAGIPVTIAGHSITGCDVPWRDARYGSRGVGIILEGAYFLADILQARASLGYHFGPHTFLGAGIAPGFWLDKEIRANYDGRLSLPVYADFRWSFRDRLVSPYIGLSAGLETTDISPYLAAEIGTRIRTDRTSTRSFWSAISGEVAGAYMRAGIKMGYSF